VSNLKRREAITNLPAGELPSFKLRYYRPDSGA